MQQQVKKYTQKMQKSLQIHYTGWPKNNGTER